MFRSSTVVLLGLHARFEPPTPSGCNRVHLGISGCIALAIVDVYQLLHWNCYEYSQSCDNANTCIFSSLCESSSYDFLLHIGQEQCILPFPNRPLAPCVNATKSSSPQIRLRIPDFRLIVRCLCRRVNARFLDMSVTPQQFGQPVKRC